MSKTKFIVEKSYQEYVEMYQSVYEELGRVITTGELRKHQFDLPDANWFVRNCPDENVKTYRDFVKRLGYKSLRMKYTFEIAFEEFAKKGLILIPQKMVSCALKMEYICPKHPNIPQFKSINSLIFGSEGKGTGCYYCGIEKRIGELNTEWKGGISSLNIYLREYITIWKKESMKNCNYLCVITGKKFNAIHHLYSFNKILKETLEELVLPIHKKINNYTNEEMNLIKDILIKKHSEYPLGVCLCKKVHNLYHKIYGKVDNTPEQFEEFKIRYNNGEFN